MWHCTIAAPKVRDFPEFVMLPDDDASSANDAGYCQFRTPDALREHRIFLLIFINRVRPS
jgi:hypothetical protein